MTLMKPTVQHIREYTSEEGEIKEVRRTDEVVDGGGDDGRFERDLCACEFR